MATRRDDALRLTRSGPGIAIMWIVVIAIVAALPWLGASAFVVRTMLLTSIMVMLVTGLNLSFGYAGELALGQAAMYGAGAYVGAWFAINVVNDLILAMLAGVVAAIFMGLLSGAPGLRLGGWALAQSSFFLVLLIPQIVQFLPLDMFGGPNGLGDIPAPRVAGVYLTSNGFGVFVVLAAAAWFGLFRNLVRSRWGVGLLSLRHSTVLAASLGFSPYRQKLKAYVAGAIPAGAAGALFAYLDSYISPSSFSLNLTISLIAASIIGGTTSVYGVLIGAALLEAIPTVSASFTQYGTVVYGGLLVLGGILLSGGVAGIARRIGSRVAVRLGLLTVMAAVDDEPAQLPPFAGCELRVSNLSKAFGGNAALADVSFTAAPHAITALIGPNGSGKTTLLNLVSGFYRADAGSISLGERDISRLPAFRVAQEGVGRTFQTPAIPVGLSLRDVIVSARLSSRRVSLAEIALRLPRYRRAAREDAREAGSILRALRLDDRADELASSLPLGGRRMLELARAIVAGHSLILLDETASGLDLDEVTDLIAVVTRLRDLGATVLLVEHNFSLVRAIADHVVVLADGEVIAEGRPDDVAAHPEVLQHYLGSNAAISGTSLTTASPAETPDASR